MVAIINGGIMRLSHFGAISKFWDKIYTPVRKGSFHCIGGCRKFHVFSPIENSLAFNIQKELVSEMFTNFVECSCRGFISKILLEDEPEQYDFLAQFVDSHSRHHDHCQLRTVIRRLHHARSHPRSLLNHVPHSRHLDDQKLSKWSLPDNIFLYCSCLFLWYRGVDRPGQRPKVGQRRSLVHDVLHLHDLHPLGSTCGRMHGVGAPSRVYSGIETINASRF